MKRTGHKTNLTDCEIIKTFVFKVVDCQKYPISEACREYTQYYNVFSKWINDHLMMKIGDIAPLLPEECKKYGYYDSVVSDKWKDAPLYKMFTKEFKSLDCNNILFNLMKYNNIGDYKGNILEFSTTSYCRQGFFDFVVSNYKSKFSNPKLKVSYKRLKQNSSDAELIDQCLYEIVRRNLRTKTAWKEEISSLKLRGDEKKEILERYETLYAFFDGHEDLLKEEEQRRIAEDIIKFGGCIRKSDTQSMSISFGSASSYTIALNDKRNGYTIRLKKDLVFDVMGNRMCLVDGVEKIDVPNNHRGSFAFVYKNNELYIHIPVKVVFNKVANEEGKVVGIDVNLKHSMFVASLEDNGELKGYVNIYKELLNNREFVNVCSKDDLSIVKDMAKCVSYMPIEMNWLISRAMMQKGFDNVEHHKVMYKTELAFSNVLDELKNRFLKNGDNINRIYIQNVIKLRAKLKSYCMLKISYVKYNQEYDLKMGFTEDDERRKEFPFRNTKIAQEILKKMQRVSHVILCCRNNIIAYIYKMFERNGYSVMTLEKLESSQMEKVHRIPSVRSLLDYHGAYGKTIDELKSMSIWSIVDKGYYDFKYEDEKIVGASLTKLGEAECIKSEFYNLALKAIHFADSKDYFSLLSNNGSISVAYVPSHYTSQMDSKTNVLYTKKNANNKDAIVSKKEVRPCQEKHINGLNGDYNAARNIAHAYEDPTMRGLFLKKTDNAYGEPLYDTSIRSSSGVLSKINSLGKTSPIHIKPLYE